jgi:putative hemolysin
MTTSDLSKTAAVKVRLAETALEVHAAQRLRYKVFYEEFGARPNEAMAREERDFDEYDPLTDHVIVVDESISNPEDQIVGTYRLLRQTRLPKGLPFYTSQEFDITSLLKAGKNLMELGRSCVLTEYRTRSVLQMLWQRIIAYINDHDIDFLFGCASLQGTNVDDVAEQLSYLHHFHRAPDLFCPKVLPKIGIDMNILPKDKVEPNARRIFSDLPPLIKGYLRIGCSIGNGAYIDHQFNSIDVCIVVPTHQLAGRYIRHYERANQKNTLSSPDFVSILQGAITAT